MNQLYQLHENQCDLPLRVPPSYSERNGTSVWINLVPKIHGCTNQCKCGAGSQVREITDFYSVIFN